MHNLWILSSSKATTSGRTRRISGGYAIDHAVVNAHFLGYAILMHVDYDKPVSDHFPLWRMED